jgi:hypothetical protein
VKKVKAPKLDMDQILIPLLGPGLTRVDVAILERCTYETPRVMPDKAAALRAKRLFKRGLLEADKLGATAAWRWRCTGIGTSVVLQYRQRGWIE